MTSDLIGLVGPLFRYLVAELCSSECIFVDIYALAIIYLGGSHYQNPPI